MRRAGRKRISADPGVSVTSMMDMFTILLIYLLYFFDPSNDPSRDLQLPTSTASETQASGTDLVVALDGISLGEQVLLPLSEGHLAGGADMGPVVEALKAAHDASGAGDGPLVVRCDKRVVYEVLETVLRAAESAGYEDYRFVVMNSSR